MGLKTKEQYRRFRVPIDVACRDHDYDNSENCDIITFRTETGPLAHRV